MSVRLRRVLIGTAYVAVWVLLAAGCATVIFLNSSRETTLASHDAVIRPDLAGNVVLLTGPVLPDVRVPTGEPDRRHGHARQDRRRRAPTRWSSATR